jgi:hypothetical protein
MQSLTINTAAQRNSDNHETRTCHCSNWDGVALVNADKGCRGSSGGAGSKLLTSALAPSPSPSRSPLPFPCSMPPLPSNPPRMPPPKGNPCGVSPSPALGCSISFFPSSCTNRPPAADSCTPCMCVCMCMYFVCVCVCVCVCVQCVCAPCR